MTSQDISTLKKLENTSKKLQGVITILKARGCLSKEYEDQFRDFLVYLFRNFVTGRPIE